MPITASILYDLMRCPHRVALDKFGNPALRDKINPFVRLLWERGTLYEREVIAKLKQPFVDLSGLEPGEKEPQTLLAIARGDPLIYGGRLSADDLLGMPDLLRKVPGGYVPGDIKAAAAEEGADEDSDGRPKVHYAVQLALYVDILERHRASAGRRGFIWDIDGEEVPYDLTQPQSSTSTDTLWDEYQAALAKARAIFARHIIPQAAYASVCKLCHWHTTCIDQLTQADDLTLIPYLSRTARDAMQGRIATIAELAASDPRGYDLLRGADIGQRVCDDERFEASQRFERHLRDMLFVDLLDIDATHMGESHAGSAELGRVGDCEIDLVFGRHSALESHAVGLGHNISMTMLREIEALLLRQCCFQIARLADQAGLAFLADSAFEERLDEDQLVPVNETLDLVFRGTRTQNFGCWEVHMREQARSMQHASDVHSGLPKSVPVDLSDPDTSAYSQISPGQLPEGAFA
jgi:PD-(D/E)XK nuclease superfamily